VTFSNQVFSFFTYLFVFLCGFIIDTYAAQPAC